MRLVFYIVCAILIADYIKNMTTEKAERLMNAAYEMVGAAFKIIALPFRLIALLWRGIKIPADMIERRRRRNNWGLYMYYGALGLPPLAVFCASVEWMNDPNQGVAEFVVLSGLICFAWACLVGIAFMRAEGKPPVSQVPESNEQLKRRRTPFTYF